MISNFPFARPSSGKARTQFLDLVGSRYLDTKCSNDVDGVSRISQHLEPICQLTVSFVGPIAPDEFQEIDDAIRAMVANHGLRAIRHPLAQTQMIGLFSPERPVKLQHSRLQVLFPRAYAGQVSQLVCSLEADYAKRAPDRDRNLKQSLARISQTVSALPKLRRLGNC